MEVKMPEYIYKLITEEEETLKMQQIEKTLNLENILILKVYFQLGVKTIEINKSSTLE